MKSIVLIEQILLYIRKEGGRVVLKYISAFILPGLMVLFFTRVTYNRVLSLVLTVALITASVYKGYTNSIWLIVVDAFSLTVGFWYSDKFKRKIKKVT